MLLLDTHIWWWAAEVIDKAPRGSLRVAAISAWELAVLAHKGRIVFNTDPQSWFERALARAAIELVPITPQITREAYRLSEPFHEDPADRLIVATARILGAAVVTKDQKIQDYPHLRTYWS